MATENLASKLFGAAQELVRQEIAETGQGNLIAAVRSVVGPEIKGLCKKGQFNKAARWVVRMDGARLWRTVGSVEGTQALAVLVANRFVKERQSAKACFFWRQLFVHRYCSYWSGRKQIQDTRKNRTSKPNREEKEFLDQCEELTEDVKLACESAGQQLIKTYEANDQAHRVASVAQCVDDLNLPRRPKLPKAAKLARTEKGMRDTILMAAGEPLPTRLADRLTDHLMQYGKTDHLYFKKWFFNKIEMSGWPLDETRRATSTDREEDANIASVLLSVKLGKPEFHDEKAVLEFVEKSQGAAAVSFYAPDVAYQWRDPQAQPLFARYEHDIS